MFMGRSGNRSIALETASAASVRRPRTPVRTPVMIRHVERNVLIQTLIAAEQGSFHKAGTLLGIPASTVSHASGVWRPNSVSNCSTAIGMAFVRPLRATRFSSRSVVSFTSPLGHR
jgi:hypothetical protein